MSFLIRILITITFCSCSINTDKTALAFTGKVIGVIDGDTIEVLYNGKPLRIRLAHIDCPETGNNQPFGKAAKSFNAGLCFGKEVILKNEGVFDRYGRLVAEVFLNDTIVLNKELIKAGLAWHFSKYSTDTAYKQLETEARMKMVGLWQDESPIAPWEWRNHKKREL